MGTANVLLTDIQKLKTITFWYLQNSPAAFTMGHGHPACSINLHISMVLSIIQFQRFRSRSTWKSIDMFCFLPCPDTHKPTHLSPTTVNSFKSTGPEFAKKIQVLLNFLSFTHHCDLESCTSYESVKPLWRWPSWKDSNIREKVTFRPFSKLLAVL